MTNWTTKRHDLSTRRRETGCKKTKLPWKSRGDQRRSFLSSGRREGKFHLPAQIADTDPRVVQQQWIDKSGSVQLFAEKAFDQETRKRFEQLRETKERRANRGKRKRTVLADCGRKEGKIYGGHFIESDPVVDHLRAMRTSLLSFFLSLLS